MTEYSTDLKIEVAKQYLSGKYSYSTLAQMYGIKSLSNIRVWTAKAKAQGLESLRVTHQYKSYSPDEKLAVVDYYRTHDVGVHIVAAKFKISPSQVCSWNKRFEEDGASGLRRKRKGRKPTVTKKSHKNKQDKLSPTEKERLIQENIHLREELYHAQMKLDIAKKFEALLREEDQSTKHK